jgi:hypothetical protein
MYRLISASGFAFTTAVVLSPEEFWRRHPLWLRINGQMVKIGG